MTTGATGATESTEYRANYYALRNRLVQLDARSSRTNMPNRVFYQALANTAKDILGNDGLLQLARDTESMALWSVVQSM